MKNISYIILVLFLVGCKSVQSTKNNQIDTTSESINKTENIFKTSEVDLSLSEVVLIPSDPLKPTTFTDSNGNKQTFENVKEIKLTKKKEVKKDTVVKKKADNYEKKTDNLTIAETAESISDANNYKVIAISIAVIAICLLIIYLVFKFKK
ncbi:hypothetical protein [Polaribacter atrinae]|uniref:hypothetical protein n=1 Tax=Polaribacter atrinae TaxID=1333662 RepID=UPI0030F51416